MTGTAPAVRWFHGTLADLAPGDVLLPGDAVGRSNFGRSAHVYVVGDPLAAAVWAAMAAEDGCELGGSCAELAGEACAHWDAVLDGRWPACIRVYEVAPAGMCGPDDSDDVEPRGWRCASAEVLRRVGPGDRPAEAPASVGRC